MLKFLKESQCTHCTAPHTAGKQSSAETANASSLLKVKSSVEKFSLSILTADKITVFLFSWGVSLTPSGNLIFTEINEKHNLKYCP